MPPFDVFYPQFMPLIGHPELVGDPRYTMKSITENKLHGEFIAIIDEAFSQKTPPSGSRFSRRPTSRIPLRMSGRKCWKTSRPGRSARLKR